MRKITILLSLFIISVTSIAAGISKGGNGAVSSTSGRTKAITASVTRATQESEPQTLNKTQGFQTLSLVRDGSDYVLSLKNTYAKAINGYSIGVGATSKITTDLTIGDNVIGPEQVVQVRIPASRLQMGGTGTSKPIIVLGVLFEDGTSDGDTQVIAEVTQRRIGARLQLKRIVPFLRAALASKNGNNTAILEQLKSQILSLPENPDPGQPPSIAGGLRSAKQDVITMLEEIERDPASLQEKLPQIKAHADKRLVRLETLRN
jgi:hypothetical protein